MDRLTGNQLSRINLDKKDHFHNPYPAGWSQVEVPADVSGDWSVQKFEVTEHEASLYNLRLIRDGQSHRIVPPGTYTRLVHRGEGIIMSDTPAEAHEHNRLFKMAEGKVLLNGLGLGFALKAILTKPEVEQVTIIEKSPNVIKLVAQTYKDARVTVINADALEWRPAKGQGFNIVWHDIWMDICGDNKAAMSKLKRAYARKCGWQACWSEGYLR